MAGYGMGFSISDFYWNRFFGGEKKNIDIFELIDASIKVAAIERPKEFLTRRMDTIHFLLEDHSIIGKENRPRKVLNQDDFGNKKRKADDYHSNVKQEKKIRTSLNEKKGIDSDESRKVNQDQGTFPDDDVSDFTNQLVEIDVANAPCDDHSNVKEQKSKIRKSFEEQENYYIGTRRVDSNSYENKFEISKARFIERKQQIQRYKRKVQILEGNDYSRSQQYVF